MAGTALDSSVIIAGLLTWHEAHSRVYPALEAVLSADEPAILPVHALLEAYSVITRLPPPRRLSPEGALTILSDSLRESTQIVGLDEETWPVIEELVSRSVAGGITYDGFILACARKAGANRLLTLNGRHFERLLADDDDLEVWEPPTPAKQEPEQGKQRAGDEGRPESEDKELKRALGAQ